MAGRLRSGRAVLIGAAVAVWTLTIAAQTPPTQTASTDLSPTRLAGQWHLNKELSTPGQDPNGDGGQGAAPGNRGGGRGGAGGGGGGGGRGGRGGMGGGGGRGGGGAAPGNSSDMLKMRALMRALATPADVLNIVIAPTEVTMTDEQGAVRKFQTDGKKQEVDFGPSAKIDTKTKWDADVLTQELTVGSLKVNEKYQVTVQGNMMVITIQQAAAGNQGAGGGRGQIVPIKYVYDKEKQM